MKSHLLFLMMLLIVMVVFTGYIQAQDVQPVYKLKTREINPVTNQPEMTSEISEIGENESKERLSVYFQSNRISISPRKNEYFLHIFSSSDLGCSGVVDNYVKIKLENGEILKLANDLSKTNCKVPVESIYKIEPEALEKLKANNIESIKLKQSKYYSDYNIWFPDFFSRTIRMLERH